MSGKNVLELQYKLYLLFSDIIFPDYSPTDQKFSDFVVKF